MKFAVISAGEGSRLAGEGSQLPKPLVQVGGAPMIGRLLDIMHRGGADTISVIVNPANVMTIEYLDTVRNRYNLNVVVKATSSSMHSLYELSQYLEGDRFCVMTVDTVFREESFHSYLDRLKESSADGVMGVTSYIDDEKPLYVRVGDDGMITGFFDTQCGCRYVSGGIYGLGEDALPVLRRCVESGESRMRSFQRRLVAEGLRLEAFDFGKIIDVDHLGDIRKAENLLK